MRSKEAINWQINFPFLVSLGLSDFPEYFFVASPRAPWFSGQFVDNDKGVSCSRPSRFTSLTFAFFVLEAEVSLAANGNNMTTLYFIIYCVAFQSAYSHASYFEPPQ